MRKVIVFGSLNMDLTIGCEKLPANGETISGYGFMSNPGGKGGNQAVAAAKLGAPTYMIASVGEDLFGDNLISALKSYKVNCDNVIRIRDESSGVAVIFRNKGDNRIILSAGANSFFTADAVEKVLEEIAQPGDVFIAQYECNPAEVNKSLEVAKRKGLYTIFNPAPARKIPDEAYESIDLLVVNQTESEFLTGIYPENEESCQKTINLLKEKGANGILITLGKSGSISEVNNKLIKAKCYEVKAIDTTAAGDTYIGALAVSLINDKSLLESMDFASRASSLTVTICGAQNSIPTLASLKKYYKDLN